MKNITFKTLEKNQYYGCGIHGVPYNEYHNPYGRFIRENKKIGSKELDTYFEEIHWSEFINLRLTDSELAFRQIYTLKDEPKEVIFTTSSSNLRCGINPNTDFNYPRWRAELPEDYGELFMTFGPDKVYASNFVPDEEIQEVRFYSMSPIKIKQEEMKRRLVFQQAASQARFLKCVEKSPQIKKFLFPLHQPSTQVVFEMFGISCNKILKRLRKNDFGQEERLVICTKRFFLEDPFIPQLNSDLENVYKNYLKSL